eukprot:CAMPEP_0167816798 /NCGR_PEP_ID=MMETSP0112_2-20121227/3825_1 /TAXON_ID=91324 /ORGANISM="Lotharella globosa, Strain CCCM811" /LENGTH=736 /DNA_ID=CAMNT_0007716463 /DNA_START=236 /DNA_END=2446 /DNA_ORIENTATION=+
MEIFSCPETIGAPVCEIGDDERCVNCGGVPAGAEGDDDEGYDRTGRIHVSSLLYCPLEFGKPACEPGDDGCCDRCGLDVTGGRKTADMKGDRAFLAGLKGRHPDDDAPLVSDVSIIDFCPMTMGASPCPPSGPEGRCGTCGAQVAESGLRLGRELDDLVAAGDNGHWDDEDDDEIIQFCPISMGSEPCHTESNDGRCETCGMRVAEDLRTAEEKTARRRHRPSDSAASASTRRSHRPAQLRTRRSPFDRDLLQLMRKAEYCPMSMGKEFCPPSWCTCGATRKDPSVSRSQPPRSTLLSRGGASGDFDAILHKVLATAPYCPITMGAIRCDPADCACRSHSTHSSRPDSKHSGKPAEMYPVLQTIVKLTSASAYCPLTMGAAICSPQDCSCGAAGAASLPRGAVANRTAYRFERKFRGTLKNILGLEGKAANEEEPKKNPSGAARMIKKISGKMDAILRGSVHCPKDEDKPVCSFDECTCDMKGHLEPHNQKMASRMLKRFPVKMDTVLRVSTHCSLDASKPVCAPENCTCELKELLQAKPNNTKPMRPKSAFSRDVATTVHDARYCPISMGKPQCKSDMCTCLAHSHNDDVKPTIRPMSAFSRDVATTVHKARYCPISMGKPRCNPDDCTCPAHNQSDEVKPTIRPISAFSRDVATTVHNSQYCPISMGKPRCKPDDCTCPAHANLESESQPPSPFKRDVVSIIENSKYCPLSMGKPVCPPEQCECHRPSTSSNAP